jgi:hypothetical protein
MNCYSIIIIRAKEPIIVMAVVEAAVNITFTIDELQQTRADPPVVSLLLRPSNICRSGPNLMILVRDKPGTAGL